MYISTLYTYYGIARKKRNWRSRSRRMSWLPGRRKSIQIPIPIQYLYEGACKYFATFIVKAEENRVRWHHVVSALLFFFLVFCYYISNEVPCKRHFWTLSTEIWIKYNNTKKKLKFSHARHYILSPSISIDQVSENQYLKFRYYVLLLLLRTSRSSHWIL